MIAHPARRLQPTYEQQFDKIGIEQFLCPEVGEALQPASRCISGRTRSSRFYALSALKVGRGVATPAARASGACGCRGSFYALKVGRGVATPRPAAPAGPRVRVSMPSRSGEALQRVSVNTVGRWVRERFYALKVGRGVATRTPPPSSGRRPGRCFYALKVGRGVATPGLRAGHAGDERPVSMPSRSGEALQPAFFDHCQGCAA